jgi:hypothetical protein
MSNRPSNGAWAGGTATGRVIRPTCRRCGGLVEVGRHQVLETSPMCATCFQAEQARSCGRTIYDCSPFRRLNLG